MPTRHDEGTLVRRATDKPGAPALHFNSTVPEGAIRAGVGLVHGYAEYGARYAHVVEAWADRGIATVSVDLRGHGHSEGPRGYCERFTDYLDDAAELVPLLDERVPGAPRILFGHSLGGLIAASSAIANPSPWRALVLSGPFFGLAMNVQRNLTEMVAKVAPDLAQSELMGEITSRLAPRISQAGDVLGTVASRLVPKLEQPSGLRGSDVTRDPERARAYDEDPLIFKTVTMRWFAETRDAQARALANAPSLKLPLYMVMGLADRVAKVESMQAFFQAAGSADKTSNPREGLFHEVLNEPEWKPIAEGLADWMLAHV